MTEGIRIDKWLWAVRLFKTRSLATDYCKRGRVLMGGMPVKPSRLVLPGDQIQVYNPPVTYTYEVTGLLKNRVSAKVAAENYHNLTPQDELDKLKNIQEAAFYSRDRGAGRPTKKERRDLDKLGF